MPRLPFTLEQVRQQADEIKLWLQPKLYADHDIIWAKFSVDEMGLFVRIYRASAVSLYWGTFDGVRALYSPLRDPMHPLRVCGVDVLQATPPKSRMPSNPLAHRDDLFFTIPDKLIDVIAQDIRNAHNTNERRATRDA